MRENITNDKTMEKNRTVDIISAPGNIKSSVKASVGNNDASCIYDNQNHAVGSIVRNEDGREFVCTEDGTWQISNKK